MKNIFLLLFFLVGSLYSQIPPNILMAINNNDVQTVQSFFDSTGNVNVSDSVSTMTPLMYAASNGNIDMLNYFISHDANVNERTILGETALIFAVLEAQEQATRILISNGADVNVKTKLSQTPINIAAGKSNLEIIKLLVDNGAVVQSDDMDVTPLHLAVQREYLDNVKYLLENGADVHSKMKNILTPLMLAARNGDLEIAQLLLENGAKVNVATPLGETPFFFAVNSGNHELVNLLIEKKAETAVVDSFKTTPLLLAASAGDSVMVDILIPVTEDKNFKNSKNKTAYDVANENEFESVRLKLFPFLPDSVQQKIIAEEEKMAAMLARGYDTEPKPIGGMDALMKKLSYPKKAKEQGLEGTVLVSVRINDTGRVRETKILESFDDKDCNKEAENVIKRAKWSPPKLENEPVEGWVDIPIVFKIPEEKPKEAQPEQNQAKDGQVEQDSKKQGALQAKPTAENQKQPTPSPKPATQQLQPQNDPPTPTAKVKQESEKDNK